MKNWLTNLFKSKDERIVENTIVDAKLSIEKADPVTNPYKANILDPHTLLFKCDDKLYLNVDAGVMKRFDNYKDDPNFFSTGNTVFSSVDFSNARKLTRQEWVDLIDLASPIFNDKNNLILLLGYEYLHRKMVVFCNRFLLNGLCSIADVALHKHNSSLLAYTDDKLIAINDESQLEDLLEDITEDLTGEIRPRRFYRQYNFLLGQNGIKPLALIKFDQIEFPNTILNKIRSLTTTENIVDFFINYTGLKQPNKLSQDRITAFFQEKLTQHQDFLKTRLAEAYNHLDALNNLLCEFDLDLLKDFNSVGELNSVIELFTSREYSDIIKPNVDFSVLVEDKNLYYVDQLIKERNKG